MGFILILAAGLIGFLIFFLFTERNMQKSSSEKSRYRISSRFVLIGGIFFFFIAVVFWYGGSQGLIDFKGYAIGPHAIFYLAYSYFGIKGVVGLLVLFGILSIVKAKSLMRKSEQTKEECLADDRPDVKARKIMKVALINVAANALIMIAVFYAGAGRPLILIIGIVLLIDSIAFFLYATWKKKELTKNG